MLGTYVSFLATMAFGLMSHTTCLMLSCYVLCHCLCALQNLSTTVFVCSFQSPSRKLFFPTSEGDVVGECRSEIKTLLRIQFPVHIILFWTATGTFSAAWCHCAHHRWSKKMAARTDGTDPLCSGTSVSSSPHPRLAEVTGANPPP
jgi:hypothetical protein